MQGLPARLYASAQQRLGARPASEGGAGGGSAACVLHEVGSVQGLLGRVLDANPNHLGALSATGNLLWQARGQRRQARVEELRAQQQAARLEELGAKRQDRMRRRRERELLATFARERAVAARRVFDGADANRDGTLDLQEFAALEMNAGVGAEEVRRRFARLDANGDGVIDAAEFTDGRCAQLLDGPATLSGTEGETEGREGREGGEEGRGVGGLEEDEEDDTEHDGVSLEEVQLGEEEERALAAAAEHDSTRASVLLRRALEVGNILPKQRNMVLGFRGGHSRSAEKQRNMVFTTLCLDPPTA